MFFTLADIFLNFYVLLPHNQSLFSPLDDNDCTYDACDNGQCVDGVNDFTCDCDGTGYKGDKCETSE